MKLIDAVKGAKLKLIDAVDMPSLTFSSHITDAKPTKVFHDAQMMSFRRLSAFSPCGQLVVVPYLRGDCTDKSDGIYPTGHCSTYFLECSGGKTTKVVFEIVVFLSHQGVLSV
ncbi:hypothetical protein PRIPAC_76675 [Pristionchus pacificus]|uniref:Uncharacterized protein n=1 Tax=Pristionchus pacificus TaxID=54126 RepID=A0A2A6CFF3_PRIPA|nr:hypothetical protein PRIPAC_76675 [Pristionchus pacificus]|eukprot:PDM76975.1 hypothetical protein PRIPAC_42370 [Pristionchus pacificus]